jgi:hypothetical protein
MRRGEIYRFEPVINRPGQSTKRLVVSADAVNDNERIPYCFAMHVVLPPLTHHNTITRIPIQKHLMARSNQPPMQPSSILPIGTGVTDEYPGHHPS